jgi:Ser/Thr protein kinase RdoA (MazF antagonist)
MMLLPIAITMSDSCLLPQFDAREAAELARRLYALEGPLKLLNGERDLNFLVSDARGKFVFKIANAEESAATLDCQHRVFERLAAAQAFPLIARALPSLEGREIETVSDAQGQQHYCRVLPFLEGRMWADFEISKPELLTDLGTRLAALDRALDGFSHPGLERALLWNMETTAIALEQFKPLLPGDDERRLIGHFEDSYRKQVLPLQQQLRRGVIHNDANRNNVIVDDSGTRVVSVIDFGDMIHSWQVLEPAIAAAYAMHGQPDPLACAQAVLAGYHRGLALGAAEIDVFFDLVCMRLCMSVCLCAYQQQLEPDNAYLSIDLQKSRDLLQYLQTIEHGKAQQMMRSACA